MIASLIVYGLTTSCFVGLAALGAERAARSRGWPVRGIWIGALVMILALMALAPTRRAPSAVIPADTNPATASVIRVLVLDLAAASDRLPTRARYGLLTAWICAGAGLIALFLVVQMRYARLRRAWPQQAIGTTTVRVAPRAGPAVMGVVHPEIVVPAWLLGRTMADQELVVAHEAEHVRARDPALLAAAWLLTAAMPWNAIAWWIASRLRLAVEIDCDARVLRVGMSRSTYGNLLIDMAARQSGFGFAAPSLLARSSNLKTRLLVMQSSTRRIDVSRTLGALAVAIASLVAACKTELPPSPDAPTQRAAAMPASFAAPETTMTHTIDGELVTRGDLDAGRGRGKMVRTQMRVERTPIRATGASQLAKAGGTLLGVVDSLFAIVPAQLDGDDSNGERIRIKVRMVARLDVSAFQGLLFVDGKRVDATSFASVNDHSIASLEVIGGSAAAKIYSDPAAANGVILVTRR